MFSTAAGMFGKLVEKKIKLKIFGKIFSNLPRIPGDCFFNFRKLLIFFQIGFQGNYETFQTMGLVQLFSQVLYGLLFSQLSNFTSISNELKYCLKKVKTQM